MYYIQFIDIQKQIELLKSKTQFHLNVSFLCFFSAQFTVRTLNTSKTPLNLRKTKVTRSRIYCEQSNVSPLPTFNFQMITLFLEALVYVKS